MPLDATELFPTLTLRLKGEYWEQIRAGTKLHEFRLATPRNEKLILARPVVLIAIWHGYPPATATDKRLLFFWNGVTRQVRQHPHFGTDPVTVLAIDLSRPLRS